MLLFFEPSLIQKKVLEGLQVVGGAFNENKISKLHNSEIVKQKKKENKKPELSNSEVIYLTKFLSNVNQFIYFRVFFHSKVSELQKISYDFII